MYRASMLAKLVEVPGLHSLLPFVKTVCSSASSFVWADADVRHTIEQHQGGERGDALMPFLFSLGVQNALEEVRRSLEDGECSFAFLNDICVSSSPERNDVEGTCRHPMCRRMSCGHGRAIPLVSRSSALQWGMTYSWRISWRNGWERSENCGTHCRCSSSAQGLDVIICCARFHHDSVCRMCAWARFWDRSRWHQHHHSSQFEVSREDGARCILGASWADALPMLQQRLSHLMGQVMRLMLCRSQCPDWTVTGSSLVLVGRCCDEVPDLDLL